jgi:hypothetical protein
MSLAKAMVEYEMEHSSVPPLHYSKDDTRMTRIIAAHREIDRTERLAREAKVRLQEAETSSEVVE